MSSIFSDTSKAKDLEITKEVGVKTKALGDSLNNAVLVAKNELSSKAAAQQSIEKATEKTTSVSGNLKP